MRTAPDVPAGTTGSMPGSGDSRSGYAHPAYAEAVADGNATLPLIHAEGCLILRKIPGTDLEDASAPYPFLVCRRWSALDEDLAALPSGPVSLVVVTDPLAEIDPSGLHKAFNRLARPYKEHFVIGLDQPVDSFADPHHLGCARRALRKIDVECCSSPLDHIDVWMRLYGVLAERHGLSGRSRFSETSLRRQFGVPGCRLFRAERSGRTIGMIVMMEWNDSAYFHLGAYDAEGYRRNASYALVRAVIDHYAAARFRWLSIGAGAGAFRREDDGLIRFKRGWASGTRTTYLCGHVFDESLYAELAAATGTVHSAYFPAYRTGEFGSR